MVVKKSSAAATTKRRSTNPEKVASVSKKDSTAVAKIQKKGLKPTASIGSKRIYNNSVEYHRLKRKVLAPFIATLLIKRAWKEITSNLDGEGTVFDPRVFGNDSNQGDMTLGRIIEQDDSSETSYQEDWRSGNGYQSESESSE